MQAPLWTTGVGVFAFSYQLPEHSPMYINPAYDIYAHDHDAVLNDLDYDHAALWMRPEWEAHRDMAAPFGGGGIGEFTYARTYARENADGTMECWNDTVYRCMTGWLATVIMQARKGLGTKDANYQSLARTAREMYRTFFRMEWLPPGRGLWTSGTKLLKRSASPGFNCGFASSGDTPIQLIRRLGRIMDLLMCGCGVGSDMQAAESHIRVLSPSDAEPLPWVVADEREGWVRAFQACIAPFFIEGAPTYDFDVSEVRPAGVPLKTMGGVSSGPEPLLILLDRAHELLTAMIGFEVDTNLCADLVNLFVDTVSMGNIRRSAEILLGRLNDYKFVNLKNYKGQNEYRAAWGWGSNNTVCTDTDLCSGDALHIAEMVIEDGEPGIKFNQNVKSFARMNGEYENSDRCAIGINPCLRSDALLLTPSGCRRLRDINIGDSVWDGHKFVTVTNKWSTGVKPVHRYETSHGWFEGTSNHRIVQNGVKIEVGKADSMDLCFGPFIEGVADADSFRLGFLEADDSQGLDAIITAAPRMLAGYIAGVFAAAGTRVSGGIDLALPLGKRPRPYLLTMQAALGSLGVRSFFPVDGAPYLLVPANQHRPNWLWGDDGWCGPSGPRAQRTAPIIRVVNLGEHEVFDITVDSPEHVFWSGANVITSNCGEQPLHNNELCNLSEIILPNIRNMEHAKVVARHAYLWAKAQTFLTHHDPEVDAVCRKYGRLGVGITGICQWLDQRPGKNKIKDLAEVYDHIVRFDVHFSRIMGVTVAHRLTTCKPSGTVSKLPGITPGVHRDESRFMLRRVRVSSMSPLVEQARGCGYPVEVAIVNGSPDYSTYIIGFPMDTLATVSRAEESMTDQIMRAAEVARYWADNAVSITVNIPPHEQNPEAVSAAILLAQKHLKTVSFLPYASHGYVQAPEEAISEETYRKLVAAITPPDRWVSMHEMQDTGCDGGACEVRS